MMHACTLQRCTHIYIMIWAFCMSYNKAMSPTYIVSCLHGWLKAGLNYIYSRGALKSAPNSLPRVLRVLLDDRSYKLPKRSNSRPLRHTKLQ